MVVSSVWGASWSAFASRMPMWTLAGVGWLRDDLVSAQDRVRAAGWRDGIGSGAIGGGLQQA